MRRLVRALALVTLAALAVPVGAPLPAAGEDTVLTFAIREARAYLYRVPLRSEVIEAARNADPCDPEADPYQCDTSRYNRKPNCTGPVIIGKEGKGPEPAAPRGAQILSGEAGQEHGAGARPRLSSAITLNELLTLASLGSDRGVEEAAGLATDSYVDLSGRQEPEVHSESDAFTPTQRSYEERCLQEEGSEDSYRHVLSRSSTRPETYHLAECAKDECTFQQLFASADTVRGRTVVHLRESGGKVRGLLEATFQKTSWGDGAFTVDLLETFVSFESDGTADGLAWSVATIVAGAELGGEGVAIAPGEVVGNEDFQVGLAAPFVEASDDGKRLQIVAPGLFVATAEQSVFFAGAEVDASFGRAKATTFEPAGPPSSSGSGGPPPGVSGGSPTTVAPPSTVTETPETADEPPDAGTVAAPEQTVSITEVSTGTGPMVLALGVGLAGLTLILLRWIGRFDWGRRLHGVQPLRAIDWVYRAFVKP